MRTSRLNMARQNAQPSPKINSTMHVARIAPSRGERGAAKSPERAPREDWYLAWARTCGGSREVGQVGVAEIRWLSEGQVDALTPPPGSGYKTRRSRFQFRRRKLAPCFSLHVAQ